MDLKFFYIVELNLQHHAISKLKLAKEFATQSWLTLTSESFDDDAKCIAECQEFMRNKVKFFKNDHKVKLTYAENPILTCAEADLDTCDTGDFDENALVAMSINDVDDEWMVRAAVMVYGIDLPTYQRSLH